MFRTEKTHRHSSPGFETLENRWLLICDGAVGDALPGDVNGDCYVDNADLIQVMQLGKFGTEEEATWEEGDWTGDGLFNVDDSLALVRTSARYYVNHEPYDEDAGEATNHLKPLSTIGVADVSIYYFPESGNVTAVAESGRISAIHLVSQSSSFDGRFFGPGMFDRGFPSQQFTMYPGVGRSWIEYSKLLPIGWTDQQVFDDLLVDGAMASGGDLGNVRVGNLADFPSDLPEDGLVVVDPVLPSFVEVEEANGLVTYDPATGDVFIEAWEHPMETVELVSPEGLFTGAVDAEDRYTVGTFDDANPERFFRLSWNFDGVDVQFLPGFWTVNLPGIAQPGLTQQEFFDGVHPDGVTDPSGPLNLALAIGPTFGECREHLVNGTIIGDANVDGRFNSRDLVTIFQAGEYEDTEPNNSTWSEGDWTCDGDFDTADLVSAFQAGQYEAPVAAIAIRAYDDVLTMRAIQVGEEAEDGMRDRFADRIELSETRPVRPQWLEARSVDVSTYENIATETFARSDATDKVMAEMDSLEFELLNGIG